MDKVLEKCKKHKSVIIAIFLVCLFCYYFIWTTSQPYNSCPDEAMKWDICKYIFENNKLPRGEEETIRNQIWGISYAFQPILTYMIGAGFMKVASIFTMDEFSLVVAARLVSTVSMTLAVYFVIKIADKLFKDKEQIIDAIATTPIKSHIIVNLFWLLSNSSLLNSLILKLLWCNSII